MKNKIIVLLLILSVAINVAVFVIAGHNGLSNRDFSQKKSHHFFQTLDLTQDQQIKMESMAASFHNQLKEHYLLMETKKNLLVKQIGKNKIDQSQIADLQKQITAKQDKMQKLVISHLLDVKAILNENQKDKFFTLLSKSMNKEQCFFLNDGNT